MNKRLIMFVGVLIIISLVNHTMAITPAQNLAMIEMNIICTTQHDHPLFQGYELCFYVPKLKEILKQNE